jgi:phosphatidylglycerophosphate synthase
MVNKIPDEYENPFDVILLKFIDSHLDFFKSLSLTPNILTTFSLICGVAAAYLIYKGHFGIASILFLIAYYFDCADGKFARKFNMTSKFGDYYDHICDVVKILLILYALYKTNKKYFSNLILVAPVLLLLLCIHMGYQEKVYGKDDSDSLSILKKLIEHDKHPERSIKYSKYFGCGSMFLLMAIVIFLWEKQ